MRFMRRNGFWIIVSIIKADLKSSITFFANQPIDINDHQTTLKNDPRWFFHPQNCRHFLVFKAKDEFQRLNTASVPLPEHQKKQNARSRIQSSCSKDSGFSSGQSSYDSNEIELASITDYGPENKPLKYYLNFKHYLNVGNMIASTAFQGMILPVPKIAVIVCENTGYFGEINLKIKALMK